MQDQETLKKAYFAVASWWADQLSREDDVPYDADVHDANEAIYKEVLSSERRRLSPKELRRLLKSEKKAPHRLFKPIPSTVLEDFRDALAERLAEDSFSTFSPFFYRGCFLKGKALHTSFFTSLRSWPVGRLSEVAQRFGLNHPHCFPSETSTYIYEDGRIIIREGKNERELSCLGEDCVPYKTVDDLGFKENGVLFRQVVRSLVWPMGSKEMVSKENSQTVHYLTSDRERNSLVRIKGMYWILEDIPRLLSFDKPAPSDYFDQIAPSDYYDVKKREKIRHWLDVMRIRDLEPNDPYERQKTLYSLDEAEGRAVHLFGAEFFLQVQDKIAVGDCDAYQYVEAGDLLACQINENGSLRNRDIRVYSSEFLAAARYIFVPAKLDGSVDLTRPYRGGDLKAWRRENGLGL